jgi:hypothetical protein
MGVYMRKGQHGHSDSRARSSLESIAADVNGLRVLIVNVFTIARASGE